MNNLAPNAENLFPLIWETFLFIFLGLTAVIFWVFGIIWMILFSISFIFIKWWNFIFSPAHIKKKWKTIKDVIHYTLPKWFSPMEIALIYNWTEHADITPIALYYRASKWYLKIVECEKKQLFIVTKKVKFERLIEKSEFENLINKKEVFRPDLEEELRNKITMKFTEEIDEELIRRKDKVLDINDIMFRMDKSLKTKITPNYIKRYENRYTNKYPLWLLCIWIIFSFYYLYYGIALIIATLLFMVISRYYMMVRENLSNKDEEKYLSKEGRSILEQVYWFRKYLMQVDDTRLEALTKEDPDYYEKMLPYAIALWVGDEWVKRHTEFLGKYSFWLDVPEN
jgi:hypothetical protein